LGIGWTAHKNSRPTCSCKILATYADEAVLNEKGKIDYHTFKPVLFEFPTYEYFVTGEKVGDCGKMN
jgi:hypothetical protein